jgi:multidrug efflux system membrane fusion protein
VNTVNPHDLPFRSIPAAALLVGALGLVVQGCVAHGEPDRQGRREGHAPAVPVTTALAQVRTLPVTVEAIGTVEPRSVVSVHSQVTGQLATMAFEEGAEVKRGELLFTIDPRPADVQLEQTKAVLAKDRAQAASARTTATRYADLLKRGLVPPEQADQAEAQAAALDAAVRADEAAVKSAELQKDYTIIRAPVTGRTGALMVHPGNLVRANDTMPLVVINEIAPIYVSFSVPTRELSAVLRPARLGELDVAVTIPQTNEAAEQGRVTFVDNGADPTTGTIRLKATFPNADRHLWPGQLVNVSLTLRTEPDAIVVPSEAVQTGQDGTYVFVVKADKTVEMRPVDVERTADGLAVIRKGLHASETVVTDGQLRLEPGATVTEDKAAAPATSVLP